MIVVGAGIFGATVAKAAAKQGWNVIIFDDDRPDSGSKPSACLIKPSWVAGLGTKVVDAGLKVLDDLYGLERHKLRVWPTGTHAECYRVDTQKVLDVPNVIRDTVIKVENGRVTTKVNGIFEARIVVVAAGVWCNKLFNLPGLEGKAGVSFIWDEAQVSEGLIKPWAPFKQVVSFNLPSGGSWGGDGSAIKPENWSASRTEQCLQRVLQATSLPKSGFRAVYGIRPYMPKAKPCFLQRAPEMPNVWLLTGGAKNGTIAAGWAAGDLLRRLN